RDGYKEKVFNLTISKGNYAPDGFSRDMYLINGQFPGPQIECNKGDTMIINIINELDENTSIHSHGIHQYGTPWYDGVLGITQCGIPSKRTFTYKFNVNQSGTYWYHSHARSQYMDGIIGPLIVHDPNDPYAKDYDEEITVILQDWYHTDSKILFANFLTPESHGIDPSPDNGLINGKNSFNCSSAPVGSKCVNNAPLSQFNFVHGKKYRIRIINTSAFSTFIFSIDEHPMDVIEVEGMITQRHTVHRIPINVAQRYSVIVTANQPINSYWMRSEMEPACFPVAIINCWTDNVANCVDLDPSNLKPYTSQKVPNAEMNFTLDIHFHPDPIINVTLAYINHSSMVMDENNPTLMEVYSGVRQFAANQNVYLIDKNAVVDIILISEHPFHLHGHNFWVLGSGGNGTKPDYKKLNTNDPIKRDTATVPDGGWTIFRFVSNNPGVWEFHCHIE
ncbi:20899_t:CDS:2, partial [Gigaspora margarita]